jgi:ABC-type multidrug transport system fused ATPase/permease subunit
VVAGLGDLFTLAAIGVMMLIVDWKLALASFAVMPFVLLASRVFQTRVRTAYREIRTRLARINAFVQERLAGLRVVQLFGRQEAERVRFQRLNDDHLDAHLRSIRVYALYFPAIELLTTVALASLIVAAASRVGAGTLTVGTVAAFLQLVRRFFQPLQDLSEKFNILQGAMAASERIFSLLDEPVEAALVRPATRDARSSTEHEPRPPSIEGLTVEFDDVWFSYAAVRSHDGAGAPPASARVVLRGVSFRVEPAARDARARGPHRGGEDHIVALLLRFYEPQRGGSCSTASTCASSPRGGARRLGYVQQDIFLFAARGDNVLRSRRPLTDAESRAPRASWRRPRRRRLAAAGGTSWASAWRVARSASGSCLAFAGAPSPPTRRCSCSTRRRAPGRTARPRRSSSRGSPRSCAGGHDGSPSPHRLSTIAEADHILVLHHGRLVEHGRHAALLARGGCTPALAPASSRGGDYTVPGGMLPHVGRGLGHGARASAPPARGSRHRAALASPEAAGTFDVPAPPPPPFAPTR